ncbi:MULTISPECIES: hypothetical protein [Bacillus]|nr:hypothetical protein [Bacillus sp. ES1-5]
MKKIGVLSLLAVLTILNVNVFKDTQQVKSSITSQTEIIQYSEHGTGW